MEFYKAKKAILLMIVMFLLFTFTSCSPVDNTADNPYESEEGVETEIANSPTQSSIINQNQSTEPETTEYTVTFINWDNDNLKTENVVSGNSATAPSPPARKGYTFTGWDKSFDKVESDIVITAVFNINSYTVAFNTDGGSSVASINQNFDTQITSPENPTKEGYIFSGWFPALPANMPAEDVVLTAQWEVIPVKVTSIQLDRSEFNIPITESTFYNLKATLQPSDATNRSITWTSSNTSVVSVDDNGNIWGKSAGTATIIAASQDGNHMASCVITVYEFVFDQVSGTIVKYTGTQSIVEIPAVIGGIPVKIIGHHAFYDNQNIISIRIPSSVTRIEEQAFNWCRNLYIIEISSGIQIDQYAFLFDEFRDAYTTGGAGTYAKQYTHTWDKIDQIIGVTGVTLDKNEMRLPVNGNIQYYITYSILPNDAAIKGVIWTSSNTSVVEIYDYSYQKIFIRGLSTGTSVITATSLDGNFSSSCLVTVYNPDIEGDFVFDPISGTLAKYEGTQSTVEIPASIGGVPVNVIGYSAFANNNNIKSVKLSSSVTRIEESAFQWCDNLYIVEIGSGVQIDYGAFGPNYFNDAYKYGGSGVYEKEDNSHSWLKKQ